MPSLLSLLREATRTSHETLDAAFGELDLASRANAVRFLRGHAIGLAPLFGSFRRFVEEELALECPDYPGMLRDDLERLGEDGRALPQVMAPAALTDAACGYVIAGSRLGLAVIRRNGYWGRGESFQSAYMEDDSGVAIWKRTAALLKEREPGASEARAEQAAAVAAFDTFREAFAASAATAPR